MERNSAGKNSAKKSTTAWRSNLSRRQSFTHVHYTYQNFAKYQCMFFSRSLFMRKVLKYVSVKYLYAYMCVGAPCNVDNAKICTR
jgi:hypothetical protein